MKTICPRCHEPLQAGPRLAGMAVNCPKCGALIWIPKHPDPSAPTSAGTSNNPRRWTDPAAAVMVLTVLLFLAWLWKRPPSDGWEAGARQLVFGRVGTRPAGQSDDGGSRAVPSDSPGFQGAQRTRPGEDASLSPANLPEVASTERDTDVLDHSLGHLEISDQPAPRSFSRPGAAGNDAELRPPGSPRAPDRAASELFRSPQHGGTSDSRQIPSQTGSGASPPPEENIAFLSDDFTTRLANAGARSGDVQVSLMWNNVNDLDLHCIDPAGEEIFFQNRRSHSGGELDIDMNVSPPLERRPVENIYWPEQGAPSGVYHVFVNHYRNHGAADPTPFTVRVFVRGRTQQVSGTIAFGQPKRAVIQFLVP